MAVPCILTIAGSDSGGGAGIQADLKTITVLGGFGMSAITALTAQNGLGVTGIFAPDPDFVACQIQTVRDGFPIAAAKTGMLFSEGIIQAVADAVRQRTFPLVVDPVCVSQSGHPLLQENAVSALIREMIPLADLLTPNRPEAERLTGVRIQTRENALEACRILADMGAKAVLLKGGHFEHDGTTITDWFFEPERGMEDLSQPVVRTQNNHGTGCTLSAAVATCLGFGMPLRDAIRFAQQYLNHCLRFAYAPGRGAGPANHAAWITERKAEPAARNPLYE